ncbi:MAG TPA: response regulator [Tepidisphaeraceae bacterium]|jgi:CheY-like chemotaxis protein|nr:response regulator [Tepidisphaeraceae bacterium]
MANLLIVDDNIEATRPMAMIFRFFKHQVDCVASGNEALTYLADKLPDVVVLDVMMPGMDGMEVLRRIRTDARTARLSVVMYSAVSDPAYRESALQKGADDYLVKGSIQVDDMRARVEHWAMTSHPISPPNHTDGSPSSVSYS